MISKNSTNTIIYFTKLAGMIEVLEEKKRKLQDRANLQALCISAGDR